MTYARFGRQRGEIGGKVDYGEDDYFQSDKINYFVFFSVKINNTKAADRHVKIDVSFSHSLKYIE